MIKATHESLKRHNRQLVLRSLISGQANNRAALAHVTGLAKPTVSDLIAELIAHGYVREIGLGVSTDTGGKRPTLLEFDPAARQVIGVSLEHDCAVGVLADLAGQIQIVHRIDSGGDPLRRLHAVIAALRVQLDAPLLCIGVAVPGHVDGGLIRASSLPTLIGQRLGDALSAAHGAPVVVGSTTEYTAIGQLAFVQVQARHLVMLLVGATVEVGIALVGAAYHNGSDIGSLRFTGQPTAPPLVEALAWPRVLERVRTACAAHPGGLLTPETVTYRRLGHAATSGDAAAQRVIDELAAVLAAVSAWTIALIVPDQVVITGAIAAIGAPLRDAVQRQIAPLLASPLLESVVLTLAEPDDRMAAAGAVAAALRSELGVL